MDNKICGHCTHFCWSEDYDYYGDGSYAVDEWCDEDHIEYPHFNHPACEHYEED